MTEPKYPMPALTEQEREELIKRCHIILDIQPKKTSRYHMAQITLAALTAEPIHHACYRTYYPDTDEDSSRAHSESNERCARRIAGELGGYVEKVIYLSDGENAYTAPPVPVLKPIELHDCDYASVSHMSGGSDDYCKGFVDGTQHAARKARASGYEVKE